MSNKDFDGVMALTGEIVRQAIVDYMRVIPPITDNMTDSQVQKIKNWMKDKGTAKVFFENSKLFKLSGISFEWLVDQYKKGKIKSRVEDDYEDD